MRKILIIEDEENIRRLLEYDLKNLNYDVKSAKDGAVGLELGLSESYDVILVDWMLPVYSGIELVEKFRSAGLDSIIIMLTAKDEESDILQAFDAGVDGYMTKPFSPRELGARIQAHVRRLNDVSIPKSVVLGDIIMNLETRDVSINGKDVELTKKEFDLLALLLSRENVVLSRDQILSDIWDFNYDGDTRIVDVHIFKLRTKIDESNVFIHSERGIGYVAKRK
ncbi:MAG: response regulator transcription factor [Erysipelothrix sp.]|nr:response regulator transcription factor [Erysipelothrix sp.]